VRDGDANSYTEGDQTAMPKRFIQKAIKRPGALRKAAGVGKGKKLTVSRARQLTKRKGRVGQQARFYVNVLSKVNRKRKK
jgi:hypothetical protein